MSDRSSQNGTDYPSSLNPFEDENIIVNDHSLPDKNTNNEVEIENNDDYPPILNSFATTKVKQARMKILQFLDKIMAIIFLLKTKIKKILFKFFQKMINRV